MKNKFVILILIASFLFSAYAIFICGSDVNNHPHLTQGEYKNLCFENGMWKWWIVTPACLTLSFILNMFLKKNKQK